MCVVMVGIFIEVFVFEFRDFWWLDRGGVGGG